MITNEQVITNRCDSVDALMYAYCEMMRTKETNQMLEKNKDYIEFSMRSMMVSHKPYQEDAEITITGMAPGNSLLFAVNPFDIPCDVVVVPKKDFVKLQIENDRLRTVNEEVKKKLQEFDVTFALSLFWKNQYKTLHNALVSWKKATGCSTPEEAKGFIDKLNNELDAMQGVLEESDNHTTDMEDRCMEYREQIKSLYKNIESWKKATGCSTPEEAEKCIKCFTLTTLMF